MKTSIQGFGQSIVSSGVSVTSTGTAVTANIPKNSSGYSPQAVRITATSSAHVRLGAIATTNDLMVQAGDAVHLNCCGNSWISVISNSGTAIVTIAPIETGIWMREFAPTANLALNFVSSPSLDQRVTFTRASSATRVNGSGVIVSMSNDQPRFDYDPVTLAPKGLLIEEQRTNLLTYSDQFDNAVWTKNNATISANSLISPDGTLTGDKLVEGTIADAVACSRVGVSITTANAFTIYAKAGERRYAFLRCYASLGNYGCVTFDLLAGTITQTTNVGVVTVSGGITSVGNGWYRLSAVASSSGTAVSIAGILLSDTATPTFTTAGVLATPYTGNGFSGIYIWGAQLEAGAFATSYIPTTTASATRAADVATMVGANFSSWYNQTEGSVYAEADQFAPSVTGYNRVFQIDDNTNNNTIAVMKNNGTSSQFFGYVSVAGVGQATIYSSSVSANTQFKVALAYKANDFAQGFNGSLSGTDTSGSIPVVTQINIGSGSATPLNGHIRKIAYFNLRLANSELQALTS